MKPIDPIRAAVLALCQSTAGALGLAPVLIGAFARDIWLEHIHGIETGRATRDVDLAVLVESWEAFAELKKALIQTGRIAATNHALHRLRYDGTLPIDILPCGGVESAERTITWPPENVVSMNGAGLREASEIAVSLELAENLVVPVVPVSGLAALKLLAWSDRRDDRDAHDLHLLARHYLDVGNRDRLYKEHLDLITDDFDYELAGAELLGRDIQALMGREISARSRQIIKVELNDSPTVSLVNKMARNTAKDNQGGDPAALLQALAAGLDSR